MLNHVGTTYYVDRTRADGLSNLEAVFLSGLLERMRLFMNFGRHVGFDPLRALDTVWIE